MMPSRRRDPGRVVGRSPERLTIEEQAELAGMTVALEIYSPATLPLRRIEAIGYTAEECIEELEKRGLDPRHYEFQVLKPPY